MADEVQMNRVKYGVSFKPNIVATGHYAILGANQRTERYQLVLRNNVKMACHTL